MERILIIIGLLLVWGCDGNDVPLSEDCRDITESLSLEEFELVKDFILDQGDREIYCSMYNGNPHYAFEGFDTYLNPETGQQNINCDPAVSDFNELVILKQETPYVYHYLLAIRKGDLANEEIAFDFLDGMKEKRVYLLRYHTYDLDEMEEGVIGFIAEIKNELGI